MLGHLWSLLGDTLLSQAAYQALYFCYAQSDRLMWYMVTGDGLLVLTQALIPFVMLTRRFRTAVDSRRGARIPLLRGLLAVMIIGGAVEHLIDLYNIWHGYFWLAATVKNLIGFEGVATLVVFINLPIERFNEEIQYGRRIG